MDWKYCTANCPSISLAPAKTKCAHQNAVHRHCVLPDADDEGGRTKNLRDAYLFRAQERVHLSPRPALSVRPVRDRSLRHNRAELIPLAQQSNEQNSDRAENSAPAS